MRNSSGSVGEKGQSPDWPRRLKRAFLRAFPFSVVLSIILFFTALLIHDLRSQPEVSLVIRTATAFAEELDSEAGDLTLTKSAAGSEWTPSYRKAQSGHHRLLEQCHIAEVLDESDLPYLKAAFPDGRSASDEIKQIAAMLRQPAESEEEARRIVHQAARRMMGFRQRLVELASEHQRRPILFHFELQVAADLRRMAEQQVQLLGDKVGELNRESGWVSPEKPITRDLGDHADQIDKLIGLSAECCHITRVLFVLTHATSGGSGRERSIVSRYVGLQQQAQLITAALAEHPLLARPEYGKAREALDTYARSMRRRTLWLGAD